MAEYLIALAGNPNSGKTTLFNALTGLNYKVANYPGVTVERKAAEITLAGEIAVTLVDLPGIYSLSGLSIDEKIATSEILGRGVDPAPDLVVCVADSTNLERNFYLLSQLIDCGHKVVLALTMTDLAKKSGFSIYKELLHKKLGIPVVEVVAREGRGISELERAILNELKREDKHRSFDWLDQSSRYYTEAKRLGEELAGKVEEFKGAPELLAGVQYLSESWIPSDPEIRRTIGAKRNSLLESGIDPQSFETSARYRWISAIVSQSTSGSSATISARNEKIDRILTDRFWGTLIFLAIMASLFQSIFVLAAYPMNLLEGFVAVAGDYVNGIMTPGPLRSLIVNGIIAGVGSVVVFVPQIAVLFLLLALLEDSGYLSRAALLMDRMLRPVGLQGRSFIPLLSSFACAIPGILSARTIPSWGDRIATILVAPLMSCSARLPVYTVLIGAFVPEHYLLGFISLPGLTLLGMYMLGIFGAAAIAATVRRTLLKGKPALFVMEMPPYRMPIARNVVRQVIDAVVSFLKSAGTIILAVTVMLWFLASYPRQNSSEEPAVRDSYAGQIGLFIEPVIKPLGFNWEIGVSVLASFAAREVFVSSLATVYNLQSEDDNPQPLIARLKSKHEDGSFSGATAASLLVFYVFACMCSSTLAVCRRETGSWGWTAFMFFSMTGLAYLLSLVTYQLFARILG